MSSPHDVKVKRLNGNPFLCSSSPQILPSNVRPKVNSTNNINIMRKQLPQGIKSDHKLD